LFDAYYYVPSKEAENAAECGLKLSKCFDREIRINSEGFRCISALITPRDDIDKFRSEAYKCLKLSIQNEFCFIADKSLYNMGTANEYV
jgi:hypothetical protein